MHIRTTTIAAGVVLVATGLAHAGLADPNIATFQIPLPEVGTKFFFNNGSIPNSNDFNGGTVIDAHINIVLDVYPTLPDDPRTSSAAFFQSEVIVPVDIDPFTAGNQFFNVITTGADEGWSGTGTFTLSRTIDELIGGTWVSPAFYTASTYEGISADEIVLGTINSFEDSFVSVTVMVPAPGATGTLAIAGLLASRRRRRS